MSFFPAYNNRITRNAEQSQQGSCFRRLSNATFMAAMSKSWRGRIPEKWLDEAETKRRAAGLSLRQLGSMAAVAVGRAKPFAVSALSDFFKGRIASDDIAKGLAMVLELDLPPVSGRDPEVQEWCDVGNRLHVAAPDLFRRQLNSMKQLVEAIEKHSVPPK